jgi:uncharacterized protein YcfJ
MNTHSANTLKTFAAILLTGNLLTGCSEADNSTTSPDYAEVISIVEIKEKVKTPHEVCEDVTVTKKVPAKDDKQIAGTAIGAVVGGVLGNQIGGGKGKKLATAAGVVAGGYTGNKIQETSQNKNTTTTTERKCHTVTETREETVGYDVTYKIDGQKNTTRMKKKPGNRIPLKNGQLAVE